MILMITNLINANARIPYATMRLFVVVSTYVSSFRVTFDSSHKSRIEKENDV